METEAREQRLYERLDSLVFGLTEASASSSEQIRDTWEFRLHFLDEYLLLFMAGGQGRMTVDGQFIELRTGGLYLRRPGELVGAEAWNLDDRGLYVIRFRVWELDADQEIGKGYNLRMAQQNGEPFLPAISGLMLRAPLTIDIGCEQIVRLWNDADVLERLHSRIHLQKLIYKLLAEHREIREQDDDNYEVRLEQVRMYIEHHHTRKLSLDELAGVAQLSMRHFMRLFKQRYGCSAMDYLAVYRIAQAQILMRAEGGHRIKDIAQHVGFKDEVYFRRKFKQIAGVPPAAFIRNTQQKIIAYHPQAIGTLLALYIVPSGAPASHPWTDYYRRKYATDKVLPLQDEVPHKLQQLQAMAPDYIVACAEELDDEEKKQLSEIAPYVEIRAQTDWRTRLRLVATELERAGAAEAWLDRYARKAEFVRGQLAQRLGDIRLLILKLEGSQLMLPGKYSVSSVFYEDLQIKPPRELVQPDHDLPIQPEQLAEWGIDRVLMIIKQDEESRNSWRSLMQSESWNRIASVRSERVELFPAKLLSDYTAFTHDLILDEALNIWRDRT